VNRNQARILAAILAALTALLSAAIYTRQVDFWLALLIFVIALGIVGLAMDEGFQRWLNKKRWIELPF